VDRGVELLRLHPDADAVRLVTPPLQNPYKMWRIGEDGFLAPLLDCALPEPYNQPRQNLPPVFWQNGMDLTRRRTILDLHSMTGRKILPLVCSRTDWTSWIDIDTELTLQIAETLLTKTRRSLPAGVRLLVLDFDGVLTDNRAWVMGSGEETVAVHRGDGMGLALLRERGIEVFVLSSESSSVVEARCRKLGLPCRTGIREKLPVFNGLLAERGLQPAQVIYAGNDVNDLPCMSAAGCGVAPADAHPEVLRRADVVLSLPGGHGAVRELCDLLLQTSGEVA
jgi:N-acylneuraminate cytidylyltransferase